MARRTDQSEVLPDFHAEDLAEFRRRIESRFVALEYGPGPRFADLPEDQLEARFVAALRARAGWASEDDFARLLVKPAEAVDGRP